MSQVNTSRAGAPEQSDGGHHRSGIPAWRRYLLRDELGVVIVLVGLVAVVGIVHPAFLDSPATCCRPRRARRTSALMACGMVFPLAMREVDLSVGGNYALGHRGRRRADACTGSTPGSPR